METLVFSIPSNINLSPLANFPLVLYTVMAGEFVTSYLMNPVDPLDLPLT